MMNILAQEAQTISSTAEVVRQFWPMALLSFLLAFVATPICRLIALRTGIVDRPDSFLKPHEKPTPYLGGVAIFIGWVGGVLLAVFAGDMNINVKLMLGIALAGLLIMLVGLFDDLHCMPPKVKLVLNLAVAALLIWLGLGREIVGVVTAGIGVKFVGQDHWLLLLYSIPITLFIVVGACNATNLIDGLDGLCSGVLGIISIGFFILAVHLRLYSDTEVDNERLVLALAMLGASAGFLPFNKNPAKIFMGDAGSMLLGLNAAVLMLLFAEENTIRWMMGALMVFGLPVADMLLTLARRWRNGKPLMAGDRSHFYDQLRDRGLSVKKVVGISYMLTLFFVLIGISVIVIKTRYAILLYMLAVAIIIVAVSKLNMVGIESLKRRNNTNQPTNEES